MSGQPRRRVRRVQGSDGGSSYADAGVGLDAADEAVERIKPYVTKTQERVDGGQVLGGIGGFGGLFELDLRGYKRPVLVSATDGVGTKLEFARTLDRHDTIGIDLVAMVVDDLVVTGAKPLFFLDYVAVERLDPAHLEEIVRGIAEGCLEAGCALVGGETAEHPGVMPAGQYDVAGFGVGIIERDRLLGPQRVEEGDAVVAMASSGLHSNGYSLVRRIVEGRDLHDDHGLLVQTLGDALLRPTRIYAQPCLSLVETTEVHALCHVTGGGIPGNLPRVLPEGLGAVVERGTFEVPRLFRLLQEWGQVVEDEMWRVFNMGAGMLAVVPDGRAAVAALEGLGVEAWVCGRIVPGTGAHLA